MAERCRLIDFHSARGPILMHAVDLAYRFRMTVCDGCFLALAVAQGGKLVTADAKLIEKARNHKALVHLADLAR